MKGILTFFVNFFPENGENAQETLQFIKEFNKDLIEQCTANDYGVMFVPTTKEASRLEKVDWDHPFPRYVAPHIDLEENDRIMASMKKEHKDDE